MTTMEKQYQRTIEGREYDFSKEWDAHRHKMMTHVATLVEQQKLVYDGLSETWDASSQDLRVKVSCSVQDGIYSCKVLDRLLTDFSSKIYLQQFKATDERMNGHIKVLRKFYTVVAKADGLFKDLEQTRDRNGEEALSSRQYSMWIGTFKELSEQFDRVLEVCNIEKYQLLDLWEDFHIKGRQTIASIPEGEDKKQIARLWEDMAIHMNTQVLNMIIDVRGRLDTIERDSYYSEYRVHQELSRLFKEQR
jgi:hypothetical protein